MYVIRALIFEAIDMLKMLQPIAADHVPTKQDNHVVEIRARTHGPESQSRHPRRIKFEPAAPRESQKFDRSATKARA